MYIQVESLVIKITHGIQKKIVAPNTFINMLENLKNTLDKDGFVCPMLMDLSNAFGTLDHDFLFARLVTYGFEEDGLFFMKSYLTKRQHQVRVNN